jgi:hypothetical protein
MTGAKPPISNCPSCRMCRGTGCSGVGPKTQTERRQRQVQSYIDRLQPAGCAGAPDALGLDRRRGRNADKAGAELHRQAAASRMCRGTGCSGVGPKTQTERRQRQVRSYIDRLQPAGCAGAPDEQYVTLQCTSFSYVLLNYTTALFHGGGI